MPSKSPPKRMYAIVSDGFVYDFEAKKKNLRPEPGDEIHVYELVTKAKRKNRSGE